MPFYKGMMPHLVTYLLLQVVLYTNGEPTAKPTEDLHIDYSTETMPPSPSEYKATGSEYTSTQPPPDSSPVVTYYNPYPGETKESDTVTPLPDQSSDNYPPKTETPIPTESETKEYYTTISQQETDKTHPVTSSQEQKKAGSSEELKEQQSMEKTQDSEEEILDSGPPSFQSMVPPVKPYLPPPGRIKPKTMADLDGLESLFASLPGQPVEIRRKFTNTAEMSLAIARAARRNEWARKFKLEANKDECPKRKIYCNPYLPIRTADGTCNNLANPEWGSSTSPFLRLMPPQYEDGRHEPRGAVYTDYGYQSRLPSPRKISSTLLLGTNVSDAYHSHLLMQFGQFLDHDVSANNKGDHDCCDERLKNQCGCFNIDVKGDKFYGQINRTCMDFTRSNFHCKENKWIEQFNDATSYIDNSQVYGSTTKLQYLLRGGASRKDGRMATNSKLMDFLPSRADLGMEVKPTQSPDDFIAGDGRAMSQATLLSFHVLWLKEHNRVAKELAKALSSQLINYSDKSKDEILFQESRKIVNAVFQHIVYGEYLPEILPPEMMEKFHLKCHPETTYHPQANPTLKNEFSTAANRFGHSQVQDVFEGKSQPWRLGKFFGDTDFASRENGQGFQRELHGACQQEALMVDRFVSKELVNNLFNNKKLSVEKKTSMTGKGHDLASINIQRGRDHGIPNYNAVRQFFNLKPIKSWDDRPEEISEEPWIILKSVYQYPDDIDLYPGGLSENPLRGGLLGPTFSNIVADQYRMLKDGDRFFFTHTKGTRAMGLDPALQTMISSRTFGDVLCENTDIQELQRYVFKKEDALVKCSDPSRSKIDFELIAKTILSNKITPNKSSTSKPVSYSTPSKSSEPVNASTPPLYAKPDDPEPEGPDNYKPDNQEDRQAIEGGPILQGPRASREAPNTEPVVPPKSDVHIFF